MSHNYYVEILPYSGDKTDPGYRIIGPNSRHNAEKIDRGANINLNHKKYYTRISQIEEKETQ